MKKSFSVASRIKGAFSGRMFNGLIQYQGNHTETANGSFDLPLTE